MYKMNGVVVLGTVNGDINTYYPVLVRIIRLLFSAYFAANIQLFLRIATKKRCNQKVAPLFVC